MTAPLCDERSSEGSARPVLAYTWPPKSCPCGSQMGSDCLDASDCKWQADPSLVPENLRQYAASPSPQLSSLSGWNSVDERMPEPGTVCLVAGPKHWFDDKPFVQIDTWQEQHEAPVSFSSATVPVGLGWDGGFDWIGRVGYTHWMPLPPPPQS